MQTSNRHLCDVRACAVI